MGYPVRVRAPRTAAGALDFGREEGKDVAVAHGLVLPFPPPLRLRCLALESFSKLLGQKLPTLGEFQELLGRGGAYEEGGDGGLVFGQSKSSDHGPHF